RGQGGGVLGRAQAIRDLLEDLGKASTAQLAEECVARRIFDAGDLHNFAMRGAREACRRALTSTSRAGGGALRRAFPGASQGRQASLAAVL
ncbi:MAG TPA: hypothetical protein DEQ28_01830, partial [Clostridiales bacterium]|nr:hypothetical protein [Clostridiales bacterium]